MKIQDSSFNGLKVTVGTKSVTQAPTHPLTDAPKAICPINFFKVGGIINQSIVKFLNFQMPVNFAVIYLKLKKRGQTSGYFIKKMQIE